MPTIPGSITPISDTEHADEASVRAVERALGRPLREFVEEVAGAVGAVRYAHYLAGRAGDASRLFPTNFLTDSPITFDEAQLHGVAVQIGIAPSIGQLRKQLSDYVNISKRLLIRGHDISAIACWVVRRTGGACSAARVEQIFRLGFERADLEGTTVYGELRAWEAAHAPRRALP